MLARPVTAAALTAGSETLAMHFIHQCHVMRVQVPVGRNQWGERVSRLRVEFPAAVVGRMTMDLADPTAAPQLTEGGNTVIAELKNPLTESTEDNPDGNYVWLFLCPGNISGRRPFHGLRRERLPVGKPQRADRQNAGSRTDHAGSR